jgi:hypothetical protein
VKSARTTTPPAFLGVLVPDGDGLRVAAAVREALPLRLALDEREAGADVAPNGDAAAPVAEAETPPLPLVRVAVAAADCEPAAEERVADAAAEPDTPAAREGVGVGACSDGEDDGSLLPLGVALVAPELLLAGDAPRLAATLTLPVGELAAVWETLIEELTDAAGDFVCVALAVEETLPDAVPLPVAALLPATELLIDGFAVREALTPLVRDPVGVIVLEGVPLTEAGLLGLTELVEVTGGVPLKLLLTEAALLALIEAVTLCREGCRRLQEGRVAGHTREFAVDEDGIMGVARGQGGGVHGRIKGG